MLSSGHDSAFVVEINFIIGTFDQRIPNLTNVLDL